MLKELKESVHKDLKEIRKQYVNNLRLSTRKQKLLKKKRTNGCENTITELKNKITRVVQQKT